MTITDSNIRLTAAGSKVRKPAVAGMFYPADPHELEQLIRQYLAINPAATQQPKALIVPHAGYIYSGQVAGHAYACLKKYSQIIKKVILLGPAHRIYLDGLALPEADYFATPLGAVEIDQVLVQRVLHYPQVRINDAAHELEHSLEIHLPFLQTVLDNFSILPLVAGAASADEIAAVLQAVWGGDETLIVISSDLSHYHEYTEAQEIDKTTSRLITALDLEAIDPHQACGYVPMSGLLGIARSRSMSVKLLDLKNSGDTEGSRDRVVGYGAYAFYNSMLYTTEQCKQLLDIARQSVRQGFATNKAPKLDSTGYARELAAKRAVFVTLKIDNELRGCIGTTHADSSLVQCIAENAFNAAFRDPRFPPLGKDEFEITTIGISVLDEPRPLEFSSEQDLLNSLVPDSDGLIIEKDNHRATFLPEVWKSLPQPEEFLKQLKLKSGMQPGDVPDKAWHFHAIYIA
jgi:hypothetical protein